MPVRERAPMSSADPPLGVSKTLIAAGVDGCREGRDAAALGALLAPATNGELLLVAVHPEPRVVLPPELGWTAMRKQAEEALRQTCDELAGGAHIMLETDRWVPRALGRGVAREHRNPLVLGSTGAVPRVVCGSASARASCCAISAVRWRSSLGGSAQP